MRNNEKRLLSTQSIARAGIIAAIYVVLTVFIFKPISYGAIQIRVAEALSVLAYIDPVAIIGLYVGAFISNIASEAGPLDIYFGSFLTLIAVILTYLIGAFFRKNSSYKTYRHLGSIIGLLPVVVINAFGVAYILKVAFKVPYFYGVWTVAIGQAIAVYAIGYPLLQAIIKNPLFNKLDKS